MSAVSIEQVSTGIHGKGIKQGNKKCVVYIRRISRSILQWCWTKLMEWLLPDSQVSWGPRNFPPPLQNPMTDQKTGVGAK